MTDAGQQGLDLLRVFKAERPELGQLILGRKGFVPQISKKRLLIVGAGSVFMMEYAAKSLWTSSLTEARAESKATLSG